MNTEKETSKFNKWREKYSALIIALVCLNVAIMQWGDNWLLTGILILGVFVCGTIGIYDIKRSKQNKL
ncbi:hypothetical protein [Bacillus sp. SG-1]|uniref:hypothetical protein n=1 Tax=Bacillus sp. SG-1 TaxID=161544 RepID=UPI0002E67464|nr:hypothetical protein [Bacillus sp. SG-1]